MKRNQAFIELQARRARMQAEKAIQGDSPKITANIDHVIGPQLTTGLDVASLLPLLAQRGRRVTIIVEEGA